MVSAIRDLVTHLRDNPAWPDAYSHEGWVAVETSSFFRGKLGWGVAREAPYVTGAKTRYADVYARPSGLPLHLFFEFKCISAVAASYPTTIKDFARDVCTKLAGCDAAGTRELWSQGNGAWLEYLGDLKAAIGHGSFVGIGVLFIGLDDKRRTSPQRVRERITEVAIPPGPTPPIFDELLAGPASAPVVHCLAYRVDIAENIAP